MPYPEKESEYIITSYINSLIKYKKVININLLI